MVALLIVGVSPMAALASNERIEITIYSGFSEPEPTYYIMQRYFEEYERANPHIKINDLGRVGD